VTIAAFAAIIVFHEFGHFIIAKLARIPVYEFALGFGRPVLLAFTWHGTQYSIRPVPIGGFVRIAGMEPDEDVPNGFDKKPTITRVGVIAAGAGMNLVLAIIIFWIMGLAFGRITGQTTRIARVLANTPAAAAGLQPGDVLLSVTPVPAGPERLAVKSVPAPPHPMKLEALRAAIVSRPDKPIELVAKRGKSYLALRIVPAAVKQQDLRPVGKRPPKPGLLTRLLARLGVPVPTGKSRLITTTEGRIGVVFTDIRKPNGFLNSVRDGFVGVYATTSVLVGALLGTVLGRLPAAVGGPVQVGEMMTESFQLGWSQFLWLSAFISVNIGVFNLLPIPALDGSRIVFLIIERIRRRPLDRRKEAIVHLVGFALLLVLLALVTFKDIAQIVSKHNG